MLHQTAFWGKYSTLKKSPHLSAELCSLTPPNDFLEEHITDPVPCHPAHLTPPELVSALSSCVLKLRSMFFTSLLLLSFTFMAASLLLSLPDGINGWTGPAAAGSASSCTSNEYNHSYSYIKCFCWLNCVIVIVPHLSVSSHEGQSGAVVFVLLSLSPPYLQGDPHFLAPPVWLSDQAKT